MDFPLKSSYNGNISAVYNTEAKLFPIAHKITPYTNSLFKM